MLPAGNNVVPPIGFEPMIAVPKLVLLRGIEPRLPVYQTGVIHHYTTGA